MAIDPNALDQAIALASDHLRGLALPPQPAEAMAGAWSQLAVLSAESKRMRESAAAIDKAAAEILATAPPAN